MASRIKIPKLGMSMSEATLTEWMVVEGDAVEIGQTLYRLETDKVETEIESPVAGRVRLIGVAGETYEVGTVIAEVE